MLINYNCICKTKSPVFIKKLWIFLEMHNVLNDYAKFHFFVFIFVRTTAFIINNFLNKNLIVKTTFV